MLSGRLEHAEAFAENKTTCRKMHSIFQNTEVVACSTQPVPITGETGVGKELLVHAIHRISKARGQFVSINVAGLDDAMFSDTTNSSSHKEETAPLSAGRSLLNFQQQHLACC